MLTVNDSGINLALSQVPRVSDPLLYEEFLSIYNAINILAQAHGVQGGAGISNSIPVEALEDLPPGAALTFTGSGSILQASLSEALTPKYTRAFVAQGTTILTGTTGAAAFFGANQYLSGLTVGAMYYLSDTPGVYSSVPGTNSQAVGIAVTENILFFLPPSL